MAETKETPQLQPQTLKVVVVERVAISDDVRRSSAARDLANPPQFPDLIRVAKSD